MIFLLEKSKLNTHTHTHTYKYALPGLWCTGRVWEASQTAGPQVFYIVFPSAVRDRGGVQGVKLHHRIRPEPACRVVHSSSGREWAMYPKVKFSLCYKAAAS